MECTGLPDSGFLPFRERIYSRALRDRIPLSGSIELTSLCNLRCLHCYIAGGSVSGELTTLELNSIVDQLADAGCLWLLVTGGEPLLRSDFRDIYRHIKTRGIMPMLFTNGTLVTSSIADFLAEMPPYLVEISIYGATEGTHDRITGVPGSFRKAMEGIERLLDRGLRLFLKTMAMTLNMGEISGMQSIADGYGIQFRWDAMLNYTLDRNADPSKYRLSPEETAALELEHPERRKKWLELAQHLPAKGKEGDSIYQCGAGRTTFHVDSTGRVSVCMMSRQHSYDLAQGTFSKAWNSYLPKVLDHPWSRDVPCIECGIKSICGQCPGWGYLEHGDPEERVDYLCRIACMRADMLGVSGLKPYFSEEEGIHGNGYGKEENIR